MMGRLIIWFYLIFIVPPLFIIMCGLIYGGFVEAIKYFTT